MLVSEAFARKSYAFFCKHWILANSGIVKEHGVSTLTEMAKTGEDFLLQPQEQPTDSCLHVVTTRE